MKEEDPGKPKWKKFEELVANIQRKLAPNAAVTHNEMILGKSGTKRQLDITIRYNLGQINILTVIDCKDWKSPVDIGDVGSFVDMVDDVSANKGAIVCNAGFTDGAKKRAAEKGIDLYRAIDTENADWNIRLAATALCDFRSLRGFSFKFKHSAPTPFRLPAVDLQFLDIYREDKSFNDILINLLAKAWNSTMLPDDPGEHRDVEFIDSPPFTKVDDMYFGPTNIYANITVEKKIFIGQMPINNTQGFMNETTGHYTSFSFGLGLDPEIIEKEWERIEDESELTNRPTIVLKAFDVCPIIKYTQ